MCYKMKNLIPIELPNNSLTAYKLRHCTVQQIHRNTTTEFIGPLPIQWILLKEAQISQSNCENNYKYLGKSEDCERNGTRFWKDDSNKDQESYTKVSRKEKHNAKERQNAIIVNRLMITVKENVKGQERILQRWQECLVLMKLYRSNESAVLQIYKLTPKLDRLINQSEYTFLLDSFEKPLFSFEISERNIKLGLSDAERIIFIKQYIQEENTCLLFTLLPATLNTTTTWISQLRKIINQHKAIQKTITLLIKPLELSITLQYPHNKNAGYENNCMTIYYVPNGYMVKYNLELRYILSEMKKRIKSLCSLRKDRLNQETITFIQRLLKKEEEVLKYFKIIDINGYILTEANLNAFDMSNEFLGNKLLILCEFPTEVSELNRNQFEGCQPYSIEGFLLRSKDSRRGCHYKIEYVYTIQNFLFFQPYQYADPLLSKDNSKLKSPSFSLSEFRTQVETRDSTFLFSPYPIDEYHIKWLHPGLPLSEFERFDKIANKEAERKANLVLNAFYFIDVCDIKDIAPLHEELISSRLAKTKNIVWIPPENGNNLLLLRHTDFEIRMKNGTSVMLSASCREIRDIWIDRLQQACRYWRQKKIYDIERIRRELIRQMSKEYTKEKEKSKIIQTRPITIPENVGSPIVKVDTIYYKGKKMSPFKKVTLLLSYASLILFDCESSIHFGTVKSPLPYSKKILDIYLSHSYICEGDQYSSYSHSNNTRISKQYLEDTSVPKVYFYGIQNSDDHNKRSFTIWYNNNVLNSWAPGFSDFKNLNGGPVKQVEDHAIFLTKSADDKLNWIKNIQYIMNFCN